MRRSGTRCRFKIYEVSFLSRKWNFNQTSTIHSIGIAGRKTRSSQITKEFKTSSRWWFLKKLHTLKLNCLELLMIVLILIVTLFCQISEECPIACECKWKNGKESVSCTNSKFKISTLPQGLDPGTQMLDLSGNNINTLSTEIFFQHNVLNLQKIYLSNCKLKVLDKNVFYKLTNLIELDLSRNYLDSIPSPTFGRITELRELILSFNPVLNIMNNAFIALPRLIRLELTGCRIMKIEFNAFQGMSNLEWLYLDNNQIVTVQASSFYPLKSLHGLEVQRNPWNCSCALQPLQDWMKRNNVPFGVPPVCVEPAKLAGKSWDELQVEDFACLPKVQSSALETPAFSKVPEGHNASFLCRLQATPDTRVRWWNGNKPLVITTNGPAPSHYQLTESFSWEPGDSSASIGNSGSLTSGSFKGNSLGTKTSKLTLLGTKLRDSGTYSCRAESRAGSVSTNFTLYVVQNKTEHLSGRLLLYGAALAALLTLSLCLLLCVVFACGRRGNPSRIIREEKLELNHLAGLRQNGGDNVPLIPNGHENANLNGHTHNTVLSTNARGVGNNNKRVGNGNGVSVINGNLQSSNYKSLATNDPDDISDNEKSGSDDEGFEVAIVGGKIGRNFSSTVSHPVNTAQPLLKSQESFRVRPPPPPPVRPRGGEISQNRSRKEERPNSPISKNGSSSRKYPDLIEERKMEFCPETLEISTLPRREEMDGKPASSYKPHESPLNRHQLEPMGGGPYPRSSESTPPLIPPGHVGANGANEGSYATSRGYSLLSTSSNSSPYASPVNYQTRLTSSSNRTNSGKFSYHHRFKYQQEPHPLSPNSNCNQYKFKSPAFWQYHPHQRRSMPTSPVHHSPRSFDTEAGYGQSQYSNGPPVGNLRHVNSQDGSTVPSFGSNITRAGSDPIGHHSEDASDSGGEYDYHAAQLAAFLEEYRVLQLELMRMSASLQQVTDLSPSTNAPSNANFLNSNLTNNSSNMNQQLTSGTSNSYLAQNNVDPSSLQKQQQLQQQQQHQQQLQLKSILKNTGNNNNYVA